MRNFFHSSAFALNCAWDFGTSILLKSKAVSLIIGHISVALDKINLHLTWLILKHWLMFSLSLCLKYPDPLQPYQLHYSRHVQHGLIFTLFSRYLNEQNSRNFTFLRWWIIILPVNEVDEYSTSCPWQNVPRSCKVVSSSCSCALIAHWPLFRPFGQKNLSVLFIWKYSK